MAETNPRIVLVTHSFPADSPFLLAHFHGLRKRGMDVHLVCLEKYGKVQDDEAVHFAWPVAPRFVVPLLFSAALLTCLIRNFSGTLSYLKRAIGFFGLGVFKQFYLDAALIAMKPDLIHFEFGPLAVGRMHLREFLECRVIVSFRGYDLNYIGLDHPSYYQEVWQKADSLHLLGEDLWRRAKQRGCPPDKPHVLIPPAIDTSFFNPSGRRPNDGVLGTKERPLRILSIGRLVWKKGYEYALQAVKFLKDQGIYCRYEIIGSGAYLEAIAYARHDLGLENEVDLLGILKPEEVKQRMLQADVFMHAAVSEGFCNAVLEAQAMQVPVVTSDADGLAENVAHGETGFVVPRRDPQALAAKLAELAQNPDLRRKLGKAGRARVLAHFRIEDQINRFTAFYAEVLKSKF